jgi:hypothetical protein
MYTEFWSEILNGICHVQYLRVDKRILFKLISKEKMRGREKDSDASGLVTVAVLIHTRHLALSL